MLTDKIVLPASTVHYHRRHLLRLSAGDLRHVATSAGTDVPLLHSPAGCPGCKYTYHYPHKGSVAEPLGGHTNFAVAGDRSPHRGNPKAQPDYLSLERSGRSVGRLGWRRCKGRP